MDRKLKFAVIGCGKIAQKHLEVLSSFPDVEIVGISNRGKSEIGDIAKKFGVSSIYSDFRRMLDEKKPEAVLIAVSVLSVPEVAEECLKRKIPSLIEKPVGTFIAETTKLLNLARQNRIIHMVGLNRRFYSTMQQARNYCLERGPLISVFVEAPEKFEIAKKLYPLEVQERWLFANGVHCIDLLRFFGGEVKNVAASATRWVEAQNDSFQALIQFQNSATGHYVSNWSAPGKWSVTLYGKEYRMVLAPLEQGVLIDSNGKETVIEPSEMDRKFKPGLYAQDRCFVDGVKAGTQPSFPASDLEDLIKTMKLIETISEGRMHS